MNYTLTALLKAIDQMSPVVVQIAANVAKGSSQMEKSFKSVQGGIDALKGAMAALGIAALITKFTEFTGKLTDMSAKTGISTTGLQVLQMHFDQAGVSIDTVTAAVGQMSRKLVGGDEGAVKALQTLGLKADELVKMEPDKAFIKIGDAVAGIKNPMERSAIAMEVFGKGGIEVLAGLDGKLGETTESFKKMGLVLDEDLVAAGDEFGDTLTVLETAGMALIAQVLKPMLPALTYLAGAVSDLARTGLPALQGGFETLIQWGMQAQKWIYDFLGGVADAATKVPVLGKHLGIAGDAAKFFEEKSQGMADTIKAMNVEMPKQEAVLRKLPPVMGQYGDATGKAKKEVAELDPQIDRLTKSLEDQIKRYQELKQTVGQVAATPDWFKLTKASLVEGQPIMTRAIQDTAKMQDEAQKWAETNGALLAPSIKNVSTQLADAGTKGVSLFQSAIAGLPQAIMSAIQGGGSVIGAAGAAIGTNLMTKFSEKFGPAIKAALPFGIGEAVTALLPSLGALFGPVAERIGGFFRSIFGGPSAEELRGRQAVADFEGQLHSLLTQTQRNEAGNESWKMTVIAIRDAYIAAGHSEDEALAAAERLWQSSKKGAGETEAAIAAIKAIMDGTATTSTTAAGTVDASLDAVERAARDSASAVGGVVGQLDGVNRALDSMNREVRTRVITEHIDIYTEDRGGDGSATFAVGTKGASGDWFQNFGAGTRATLHGREAVVREDQAAAFAAEHGAGGGDSAALDRIERLLSDQPRALALAMQNALALGGRG
ncbi:MAG: hypothetical protein Q8T13_04880 [Acidobacteriota bacterium]|nr:hypothetical protein [Acidobacteriota bacterium]